MSTVNDCFYTLLTVIGAHFEIAKRLLNNLQLTTFHFLPRDSHPEPPNSTIN